MNLTYTDKDGKQHVVKDVVEASDGYHTFSELYEHRMKLWIALCSTTAELRRSLGYDSLVWRSKKHFDSDGYDGWFILGLLKSDAGEQITYHLPDRLWDECKFARTLDRSYEWDGHTPEEVLNRLTKFRPLPKNNYK